MADDFSNPASGFAQRSDVDGSVGYKDEALKINVLTRGIEFYAPSQNLNVEAAKVRVDIQLLSGPGSSYAGILCRFVTNPDHYDFTAFAISAGRGSRIGRLISAAPAASAMSMYQTMS